MGLLLITEKGKPVACHADWPLFYMNDFSRLGLVVNRLTEALEVLKTGGFRVRSGEDGHAVEVDNPSQAQKVCAILATGRLEVEIADLVSCAYQG